MGRRERISVLVERGGMVRSSRVEVGWEIAVKVVVAAVLESLMVSGLLLEAGWAMYTLLLVLT